MDLSFTKPYLDYQQDLRQFLAENWDIGKSRDKAFVAEFRRSATERGYLSRSIPKKFGGSEQAPDVVKAQIIQQEFAAARAPREVPGNGTMMVIPTLLEIGEEWQKEMFVPKTVLGEYTWAQGYSEPGSGSDLASLKTKAELVGDEWVINGHKIWTSLAQTATHMFCLARTEPDAPKHAGISYILLDFKQPGVTLRPLRQITGGAEFCEVFLEDVRTPANWIVGERGKGWEVSKVNLKHERNAVGSASATHLQFEKLLHLARKTGKINDPAVRQKLAEIEGRSLSHVYSGYHQQTLGARGDSAGVLSMLNKLSTSEIGKDIAMLASDLLDDLALLAPPPDDRTVAKTGKPGKVGDEKWYAQILGSLGMAIAGGTSNIQRNIIAERGLGLPREPSEGK